MEARAGTNPLPEALGSCRTPVDLRVWLQQFARRLGFYGGRYLHLGHLPQTGPQDGLRPLRFLSTASRESEQDEANGWLLCDPSVPAARIAFTPFAWTTQPDAAATARQRAWLKAERSCGVGGGVAVPIQDYAGGPAYISFFGMDETDARRVIDERAPELAFSAAQFHACAKTLIAPVEARRSRNGLTRREIECLRLAAIGWTVADSAGALGIAGRTVEFHIGNACEKLGAVSKIHAVAIATTMKMIAV